MCWRCGICIHSHTVGCGIVLVCHVKHEYVTQDTSLQAASSPGSPSSTLTISDSCSKISREMDWHVINIMRHYKTVTKMFPFSSHTLAGSKALCIMVIWPALVAHLSMAVKAAVLQTTHNGQLHTLCCTLI